MAALAAVGGVDPGYTTEHFDLDDGEAMARSLFPVVTRHDFVGELRVPAPEPIADYVRSIRGTRQAGTEGIAAAVVDALPRSADGHYVITTHAGCLVCETG